MLLSSLLLLLGAAVLHALGNVLMKRAHDKLAFSWWMLGVFCVLGAPLALHLPSVEPAAWRMVVASGLLEAIYFLTLTRAYTLGHLSVVYPVARGSAPLFLLLWATVLLGEKPSVAGMLGILAIVSGLYLINLPSLSAWNRPIHGFREAGSRWALLTGILISGYTAVDKVGVRYFHPLTYLYLVLLVCWVALSLQWLFPERRQAMIAEFLGPDSASSVWTGRKASIGAAAFLGTGAYTLVLAAMRLSPVSYVAPVREVSVVIGAWIGIRYLGEPGGVLRLAACGVVVLGICLIAVGG